jgi:hypothetical protein
MCSEFVKIVVKGGDLFLETLTLADTSAGLTSLGLGVHGVTTELFPMVEHALREGTAGGGGTESLGETEGLSDGQVSLDGNERSTRDLLLTNNHTTTLRHAVVDTTNSIIRGLDLNQEDGLLEAGLGSHLSAVQDTAGSGGDLTTTSVDSISVEGNIHDVEAAATELLIAQDTFLGGLLEGSGDGVLDFVQELALLGGVNDDVGASLLRAEAPDLESIIGVPLVFVNENLLTELGVHLRSDLLVLNSGSEIITKGNSLHVNTVVLVGRLA